MLDRKILFISGPHACGKSSLTLAALKDKGFSIFELGPLVRQIQYESTSSLTPLLDWVHQEERTGGPLAINNLLASRIRPMITKVSNLALVGSRSGQGISFFKQTFNCSDSKTIFIEAREETLYERYKAREQLPYLSRLAFRALLQFDEEMGLDSIRKSADYIIENSLNFETAVSQIKDIVHNWIER